MFMIELYDLQSYGRIKGATFAWGRALAPIGFVVSPMGEWILASTGGHALAFNFDCIEKVCGH